jgi:two-component system, NarL family, nitrate/nitrite response regulator NarL
VSTLALCDTEPIAIEGLRCLLEANGGPRIVSTETTIEDSVAAVRELRPSLLLVDRGFGAHVVMDWLRILRTEHAATAVVVWGSAISEAEALRYVQAGAGGVVRKSAPLADIMTCIRTVLSGATWMEFSLLPDMEFGIRTGRAALTARELQVIHLVERGLKNKEIGEALGIQTGTVKIHLKHIFEKTGIRGRYSLALNGLKARGLGALVSVT